MGRTTNTNVMVRLMRFEPWRCRPCRGLVGLGAMPTHGSRRGLIAIATTVATVAENSEVSAMEARIANNVAKLLEEAS